MCNKSKKCAVTFTIGHEAVNVEYNPQQQNRRLTLTNSTHPNILQRTNQLTMQTYLCNQKAVSLHYLSQYKA